MQVVHVRHLAAEFGTTSKIKCSVKNIHICICVRCYWSNENFLWPCLTANSCEYKIAQLSRVNSGWKRYSRLQSWLNQTLATIRTARNRFYLMMGLNRPHNILIKVEGWTRYNAFKFFLYLKISHHNRNYNHTCTLTVRKCESIQLTFKTRSIDDHRGLLCQSLAFERMGLHLSIATQQLKTIMATFTSHLLSIEITVSCSQPAEWRFVFAVHAVVKIY